MKKRHSLLPRVVIALVFLSLCVCLTLGLFFIEVVPGWVVNDFGEPSPRLSRSQRVMLSLQLMLARDDLLLPVWEGGPTFEVEVAPGATPRQVADDLAQRGLIHNADSFVVFLIYSGLDTSIQSGVYQMDPGWNAIRIAQVMQDATPANVPFVILAGWRLEEIAASLPTSGLEVRPEDFLDAAYHPSADLLPAGYPTDASLEGLLFPGTYDLPRNISLHDFLLALTGRFNEQVTTAMRQAYTTQGLTLQQAVTLASIIQREAVVYDEMPRIASVFLNRIAIGMGLESDPTVQYALGYIPEQQTWWKSGLTVDDLAINSLYNTYGAQSLPPGPIAAPSIDALRAVAAPESTPYYYFRAACDGSSRHLFAQTYDEHVQNACP